MNFLIFVAAVFAAAFVLEKAVRKVFRVPKREGRLYRYVNETHRWTEWSIAGAVFTGGIAVAFWNPGIELFYLLIAFYLLLYGARAFFEWKFERKSRQYILSLFTMILLVGLLWIINGPLAFILK